MPKLTRPIITLLLAFTPRILFAQSAQQGQPASPETGSKQLSSLADSLKGESKAEYIAAKVLYDDGDYAGALTKLQTAYRLSHDPRLLWNMAAAEKNLRHYSKTISYVEEYLAADSARITDEERAQAEALLQTMRAFVAPVTFDVEPIGSTIAVDGQPLGKAPLKKTPLLDFGKREVQIHLEGYVAERRTLELEGGKALTLAIKLKPEVHQGTLRILSNPNTSIRIDGKIVGVGMWQGVVPSGAHAVQFEAEKKQSQTLEVALVDGEFRTLNIQLQDVHQKESSAIPTWMWITGGVAAAALGTGAYFAFRKESSRPAVQEGTWGTLEF
jgi:hypothetical protein